MSKRLKHELDVALVNYGAKLHKHGALEGKSGCQQLTPDVKRMLDGVHKVLAGAKVTSFELDDSQMNNEVFEELSSAAQDPVDIFNDLQNDPGVEYG